MAAGAQLVGINTAGRCQQIAPSSSTALISAAADPQPEQELHPAKALA